MLLPTLAITLSFSSFGITNQWPPCFPTNYDPMLVFYFWITLLMWQPSVPAAIKVPRQKYSISFAVNHPSWHFHQHALLYYNITWASGIQCNVTSRVSHRKQWSTQPCTSKNEAKGLPFKSDTRGPGQASMCNELWECVA